MIIRDSLLWVFIGVSTAIILLKSMEWSVRTIHPENPRKSMLLIIGGALIRWTLFSTVLVIGLSHATRSGFIVLGTFLLFRLFFLLKWHGWLPAIH